MWKLLYNFFLPAGFLFFLPGLIIKYRNRGGWKDTYSERFGRFSPERRKELEAFRGAVWIHAVSVGETVVALSMIRNYLSFILTGNLSFPPPLPPGRSWQGRTLRKIVL